MFSHLTVSKQVIIIIRLSYNLDSKSLNHWTVYKQVLACLKMLSKNYAPKNHVFAGFGIE